MTTTTLDPPTPVVARSRASRWAPLPIVLAGIFMVVLDFFIVNVALPSMQTDLHAGSGTLEWVVAGYSLTAAVLLICGGRLGDRFGYDRAFVVSLALFTLASAGCGLATGAPMLIAARLLQGAGAAGVMPSVLSLITVLYAGPDRARALSIYAIALGLAAVSGQLVGGLLLAADPLHLRWRVVFLVNVPIGALALVLAPRLIPRCRAGGAHGIDLRGTVLLTAGLTAIVLPLLQGRTEGWPLWTWLSLMVAPGLLGGFWARQRTLARRGELHRALVDPALLEDRTLRRGLGAQLAFWCGQASFFLILALYLQQGRGLHPLPSGLVFTVLAVSYVATSMLAPGLTERHGRRVLTAGALLLAAGHVLLVTAVVGEGTGGSVAALVPGLLIGGAGMGLALPALATIIIGAAPPERAGAVSGVLSTAQNVGNAIGVAILGLVFFGALHHGFGPAFALGEGVLAAVCVLVAALSLRLPARVRS